MLNYFVSRIFQTIFVLLGVSTIAFLITNLVPADPARLLAGRQANTETVENIRTQLGLDRPLYEQYGRYVSRLARGDLGRSYSQRTEVRTPLLSRLPATLQLTAGGIVVELLIGVPLGILAALTAGRFLDRTVMLFSFIGVSAPQFALGLILLYVVAYRWALLPLGGYGSVAHLILPAVTLGITGAGWYARVVRSAMLETLRADYVRTGTAKGLPKRRVVLKHALRNALLPIIAMVGLDIGLLMGGVVVVESVFGWPGIGQLAWQAIQVLDIPVIMGTVLLTALFIVLGNFLADYPDPSSFYWPILGRAGAVAGGWNWAWYCNEELEAQAAEADAMVQPDQEEARAEMWRDIYLGIMEDAPWVPVFNETRYTMHSARLKGPDGVFIDPIHIPVNYENVYVE